MKISSILAPVLCAGLASGPLWAQEPAASAPAGNLAGEPAAPAPAGDLESLQKQLLAIQAGLAEQKAQHAQEISALKAQVEQQQKTIEDLQKALVAGVTPPPLPAQGGAAGSGPLFPTSDPSVTGGAAPGGGFATSDPSLTGAADLTAPITIGGGSKNYLNISFLGQFTGAFSTERDLDLLEVGDHDPQQRGFNARNIELALDGAVDPYFEAFANIVFKLDNHNETGVEVEEAFMQTTSLPWGLQLKGGQFFSAFGRINSQHPHAWDFVDVPLVQGRLLGPDGLRGVGVQMAWVAPVPWYSQLSLGVQNGNGGTAWSFRNPGEDGTVFGRETIDRPLRGAQDLLFVPRWENSIDLSPTQTVLFGVSGAFGPNDTGPHARTQIYGADFFYKWKAPNSEGGYPFVKWQSEAMLRRFEAGRGLGDAFPENETFNDWGIYSQVVWGFRKGWTAGVRGDYLHMDDSEFTEDPERQSRWRASADLTWFPTEFSKLRLQYNHDFLEETSALGRGNEDSVFLQFEFSLGAHAAHKY